MSAESDPGPELAAQECQERVDQFATITKTDEALAQFYLQERSWNVHAAIEDFFSAMSSEQPNAKKPKKELESVDCFTFVTWNIDGLDKNNLEARTLNVAKILNERKVDVVHLQEVVDESYCLLVRRLDKDYDFSKGVDVSGNLGCGAYFTITMLRKATVLRKKKEVVKFEGSSMGRGLLRVEVDISGHRLHFINSHLESTADFKRERVSQLKTSFDQLGAADPSTTVILAGDLNLRDDEVETVGIPKGTVDLWINEGKREECKYTWDMKRNFNSNINFRGFKPRCRFDRVYFRSAVAQDVKPEHFGLVGLERVPGLQVFPSDHWGIFCIFSFHSQ